MGDGTTLNTGSGGDVVLDEEADGPNVPADQVKRVETSTAAVAGMKIPVSKIVLGTNIGDYKGMVGEDNPLPVYSDRIEELLIEQNRLLVMIVEYLYGN